MLGARVHPGGAGIGAAVAIGHSLGPRLVDVEEDELLGLVRLGEIADDRGGDRAAGSKDRDPHATSSLARRASQSSMRSVARERSRPVSSSIFRMR